MKVGHAYWVAVLAEGGTLYFRDRSHGSCPSESSPKSHLSALPASARKGQRSNTCPISAYVSGKIAVSTGNASHGGDGTRFWRRRSKPTNTLPPSISGTARQGQTLKTSNGSWSNSPSSYSYQWQDCITTGCSNIAGATGSSYTLAASDVGSAIDVIVTATNSAGSASATSAHTASVTPLPPSNSALPQVTGTPTQYQTLTTTNGSWTNSPTSYSYQWQDCDSSGANCANISGATSGSYTLASGDVSHTIRAVVTAANSGGSAAASSVQTSVIAAEPPPVNTALPQVSGTTTQGQTLTATKGSWSNSPSSYSYQWQDCTTTGCSNIAGATGSTYTLVASDVNSTIDAVVTATNTAGSASAASAQTATVTVSSGSGLPTGVSLQKIDGGPNYYCSNGFTYACNAGWDSPSIFPIMDFYAFSAYGSIATFKDLGLNTTQLVTGGTNMSTLRNAGIGAVQGSDASTNTGNETVGTHIEEPGSWANVNSQATSANNLYGITGRFLQPAFTWNQFYYGTFTNSCGTSMQSAMTCTSGMPGGRHLDVPTADIYWFAGSNQSFSQTYWAKIYTGGAAGTVDELSRASNYGDMVDTMRSWVTTNPAPNAPYIESDNGLAGTGERKILPGELNWAAWDTIVHGARFLNYFSATTDDGLGSTDGFDPTIQGGQSISTYNQAKATNTLVGNLARIINSPFALGYASDNLGGYVFPTRHIVWDNGLDISTHYYTGGSFTNSSGTFGNGFYIFASVRGSESQTNVKATFTLPSGDSASGSIPYICACSPTQSTGTVTVNNHQFTDTFAKATDVHIYGPLP